MISVSSVRELLQKDRLLGPQPSTSDRPAESHGRYQDLHRIVHLGYVGFVFTCQDWVRTTVLLRVVVPVVLTETNEKLKSIDRTRCDYCKSKIHLFKSCFAYVENS
jgi:hypothetical protein